MTEQARKSPAPWHCGGCERRWDGLNQAHCGSCHRHFGSVGAFDLHRQGPIEDRVCADPATLLRGEKSEHAGRPRLRAAESPHGVVWVGDVPNSRWGAPTGDGDAGNGIQESML
jgi:hypothetical protein